MKSFSQSLVRSFIALVISSLGFAAFAETQATLYFGKFASGNSISNPTYSWNSPASSSIGAVEIKIYTRSGSPGNYVYTSVGTRTASPTVSDSITLTGQGTYYIRVNRCYTQDTSWSWGAPIDHWQLSRHDNDAYHLLSCSLPSDGAIWWTYQFVLGSTYASSAWTLDNDGNGSTCPIPTAAEIWGN